jgi:polysaccharide transporter, PST family
MNADAKWHKYLPAPLRDRIAGRPELQAILNNSGWLFADKLLRLLVGVSVGVCLARYLGPLQFGQFNFAVAFVTLLGPLAVLGLDGIVVRELVKHPDQRNLILGATLSLKLLGGIVALTSAQLLIWWLKADDMVARQMVAILSVGVLFQTFDAYDFWFQSQVKSRLTVATKSSAFVLFSLVKVALIITNAGLLAFAWTSLGELVLAGVGLGLVYRMTERGNPASRVVLWCWPRMRWLLSQSWALLFSGLAIMVYFRIDQVMLAQMVGERELGLYSAALRLSEIWYAIPTILVASASPALIASYARSAEQYYARLQKLFTNLAGLAYLVAIPMSLLSSTLILWLYGPEFAGAGTVLMVHIWTALFVFLGVGLSSWMINEGMTKFYLLQTTAGAVTNTLLNLFLIPRFGAVGASIATLISQAIASYLMLCTTARTRRLFYMQSNAFLLRV